MPARPYNTRFVVIESPGGKYHLAFHSDFKGDSWSGCSNYTVCRQSGSGKWGSHTKADEAFMLDRFTCVPLRDVEDMTAICYTCLQYKMKNFPRGKVF